MCHFSCQNVYALRVLIHFLSGHMPINVLSVLKDQTFIYSGLYRNIKHENIHFKKLKDIHFSGQFDSNLNYHSP